MENWKEEHRSGPRKLEAAHGMDKRNPGKERYI
jgi:hypothetical protein